MAWPLIGVITLLLVVHAVMLSRVLRVVLPMFENAPPFNVKQTVADPSADRIEFPTTNGLVIRGSLWRRQEGESQGVIIFCHEFGGDHWSATSYCAGLLDAGFEILAFDFRNHGESDVMPGYAPLHWLTHFEVEDTKAAVAYIRRQTEFRDVPIGLFGISRGGGAALAVAARESDVRCVACEGAFSTESMTLMYARRWLSLIVPSWMCRIVPDWHIRLTLRFARFLSQERRGGRYFNLERALPAIKRKPAFFITGGRDNYVRPEITERLCRLAGQPASQIWTVPDAKHNMARQDDPAEYDRRVSQFFCKTINSSPRSGDSQAVMLPSGRG